MKKEYANPHDSVGEVQFVFWNDWGEGAKLVFELVDYFKAPVYRKSRGVYVIYYAIARCDYAKLGFKKGDKLLLFISYNAYRYALEKLPAEQKVPCLRKYAEGKNNLMCIERVNSERIRIHSQEVREPTPEQLVEAEKQYALVVKEHGIFQQ